MQALKVKLKKALSNLLVLSIFLTTPSSFSAGDRVWIDNQTKQPLEVRKVSFLAGEVTGTYDDFYNNETAKPHQMVPIGKAYHFALINWASCHICGIKITIGTGDHDWRNSCTLLVGYGLINFHTKSPDCSGSIHASQATRDGPSGDGIINWTFTLTNTK